MDTRLALQDWHQLNETLLQCSEKDAQDLLKLELKGKKRRNFILRIYSRFNRMRAARERGELHAKIP